MSANQVIEVPSLLRLPRAERVEGVINAVRSAPASSDDRPLPARALDALAWLPPLLFAAALAAAAISVRLLVAILGRGRGGGWSSPRMGIALAGRLRALRKEPMPPVAVLEVTTPGGREVVRFAGDATGLSAGDRVTLVVRGRAGVALRAVRVEGPAGVVSAPPLVTARGVAGLVALLFIALALLSAAIA